MLKKGFTSFENPTYSKDDNKFSPSDMRVKRGLYKTKRYVGQCRCKQKP